MIKFIDPTVFHHIQTASKEQLIKQRTQLENEINKGLLIGPQYIKELDLITSLLNSRCY